MDGIWIPIVAIASVPITAIGVPIARAIARRLETRPQPPSVPSDVSARLERMEQAIDAIAVEIERVSEAQRFTTRLLADPGGQALGTGAPAASGAPLGTPRGASL